jgi:hypothetical protein
MSISPFETYTFTDVSTGYIIRKFELKFSNLNDLTRDMDKNFVQKPPGKKQLERTRRRWEVVI